MNKLNNVLRQHKQIILSINADSYSMLGYNDENDNYYNDGSEYYLATITVQYSLGDSYIAFDSECLVSVGERGKVTFEQFDTSPDAHKTHHDNIADLASHDIDAIHYDHIITDKPDFMMVEWC